MENQNLKIVQQYFNALQKGDIETVTKIFSPNIIWHQPGKNHLSGTKKGIDQVMKMIEKMMVISEGSFAINKIHFLASNGEFVNALISFSAKAIGNKKALNQNGLDLIKIQNHKIVEVWLFSSNQADEDAYWG